MSEHEFSPLLFTDPLSQNISKEAGDGAELLETMTVGSSPIVYNILKTITIPKGFGWNGTDPIVFRGCVDQSQLRIVTNQIREQTATQSALYEVKLIGQLVYNSVVSGLAPISGDVALQTGSAGPKNQYSVTSQTNTTVFATETTVYETNEIVAYVESIDTLQQQVLENFSITLVDEYPSAILEDGTVVTFDPQNPTAFYSIFDGKNNYQFVSQSFASISVITPDVS